MWKRGKNFVAFVLARESQLLSEWRFVGTEENESLQRRSRAAQRICAQASTIIPNGYPSFLHSKNLSSEREVFSYASSRQSARRTLCSAGVLPAFFPPASATGTNIGKTSTRPVETSSTKSLATDIQNDCCRELKRERALGTALSPRDPTGGSGRIRMYCKLENDEEVTAARPSAA